MATSILKSVKFERDVRVPVAVGQKRAEPTPPPVETAESEHSANIQPAAPPLKENPTSMLAKAQAHVEMMLNQAQMQVATIQEEARKTGWEAGYSEAKQTTEQELNQTVATIKQVVETALSERERFWRENQRAVGELVVAIAERIISQELNINPKIVTEIVGRAIKDANITGACRIRVNPTDYEILIPSWETIPSLQPSDKKWELVSDETVSRGGCIIEANGGTLDAQVETQLLQIKRAFNNLGE